LYVLQSTLRIKIVFVVSILGVGVIMGISGKVGSSTLLFEQATSRNKDKNGRTIRFFMMKSFICNSTANIHILCRFVK